MELHNPTNEPKTYAGWSGVPDLADPSTDRIRRHGRSGIAPTYNEAAVMLYRAQSVEEILNNPTLLVHMIRHHLAYQVPRLQTLQEYYIGNNVGILNGSRRTEEGKSDHRVRHNFAATLSDFLNSYVIGNPVKIAPREEGTQVDRFIEIVDAFDASNDIDSHNLEIGKDQNNLGRAYELLHQTNEDETKLYRLDPTEVFMIYDRTVRTRVIAACRYYQAFSFDASKTTYLVDLYTPTEVVRYESSNLMMDETLRERVEERETHFFGGVPVIEYRSDRFRLGVYEPQLPLIDAYDAAQSDTANYMTDFNDALLVIAGYLPEDMSPEELEAMRDANILHLIPQITADGRALPLTADYLTKSYDVQGVEAYKERLKEDIFNLANIPNLSDNKFAGQQTGEALKYKLFGLQQRRNDKERYLAKGFRVRYKLLEHLKHMTRELAGEPVTLDFIFTPNTPKSELEELKMFKEAGGQVSQQTALGLLSFVDDAQSERERIEEEALALYESIPGTGDLFSSASKEATDKALKDLAEGKLPSTRETVGDALWRS